MSIKIKSNNKNYFVYFFEDLNFLNELDFKNSLFIIDSNVWAIYKNYFQNLIQEKFCFIIDAKEDNKTLAMAQKIYNKAIELEFKKNMKIISIGGGIVQDVSGFVASTLFRGITWYYIPTTLLAQSDSCIGSKTSINYNDYKNLIGTFFSPNKIFISLEFINSLNNIDFFSGLGEIVKLHILGGKKYIKKLNNSFDLILKKDKKTIMEAIKNSLYIKKRFIEKDEFDMGIRNYLNYGHCFGHALESATEFKIPHGQAVTLGMLLANNFSKINNDYINNHINRTLIFNIKNIEFKIDDVINFMKKDKKRMTNDLPLVLCDKNLKFKKINNFKTSDAVKILEDYLNELRRN